MMSLILDRSGREVWMACNNSIKKVEIVYQGEKIMGESDFAVDFEYRS